MTLILEKERIKFTDGMYGWVMVSVTTIGSNKEPRVVEGKANRVPLALECSRTHTKADNTTGELEEKIFWILGHYPQLSNDCRPIHSAVQNKRRETGIDLFRTQSQLKGYTLAETYFLFVTGRSLAGKMMTVEEYMERGAAISAIKSAWIEMPNVSFNFIVNFLKISVSNLHFSSFVSIVDFPNISVSKFHF